MRMSRHNIKSMEIAAVPQNESLWALAAEAAGMLSGLTDKSKTQVDEHSK